MSVIRALAAALLVAPVVVAGCAVEAGGDADEATSSADAVTGSVAAGTKLRTTAALRLREGPSTASEILRTIPEGESVTSLGGSPSDGYYRVSYDGDQGWAFGEYLTADDGAGDGFDGRRYSGVTLLWQGDWEFLVKCDSYSRSRGRVVFFCDSSPSRSFVDDEAWIAVPRNHFSSSLCGEEAKVCKGDRCVVAKIVEKSVTSNKWEGSTAVMDALGVDVGSSGCSSSYGSTTGVTIRMR